MDAIKSKFFFELIQKKKQIIKYNSNIIINQMIWIQNEAYIHMNLLNDQDFSWFMLCHIDPP